MNAPEYPDDSPVEIGSHDAPTGAASRPPRRGIYLLPNLLTTGTLFSGFLAIVLAIDSKFELAAISVFGAMLFDGLDAKSTQGRKPSAGAKPVSRDAAGEGEQGAKGER